MVPLCISVKWAANAKPSPSPFVASGKRGVVLGKWLKQFFAIFRQKIRTRIPNDNLHIGCGWFAMDFETYLAAFRSELDGVV